MRCIKLFILTIMFFSALIVSVEIFANAQPTPSSPQPTPTPVPTPTNGQPSAVKNTSNGQPAVTNGAPSNGQPGVSTNGVSTGQTAPAASAQAPAATPAPTNGISNALVQEEFNPKQIDKLHSIIRDYLLNNPEVLIEVSQKLQQKQLEQAQQKAQQAVSENAKEILAPDGRPTVGNNNGTVTLVEFFDYQCPHCKEMSKIVDELVKAHSNLRVVFYEFPIFPGSDFISKAALAANKQGKYFQFHDALMTSQKRLDKTNVLHIAKSVGLNIEQLQKDLQLEEIDNQIKSNYQIAGKLGLMGTPAFIIGKTPVSGVTDSTKIVVIPGATTKEQLESAIRGLNQ